MDNATEASPVGSLTVGSMFCGVGGVCMAFKQAGFNVAWANDFDKHACRTYQANFPDHNLIEGDVTKIDFRTLSEVDVIAAGFPCVAFSIAGRQGGFDDPRGKLFYSTAEAIQTLRPKAYILENVKNLLSHDRGRTFTEIKRILKYKLGYSCVPFVLDSCRHGNVPQHRERVFVVGFRRESASGPLTFSFTPPAPVPLTKSVRDILKPGRQDAKYYLRPGRRITDEFTKIPLSQETIYQWRRSYVRANKSYVCPTLTANMGGGGSNVPFVCDDYGIRKLTPRECFRLQGFPDSFTFPAGMADTHLYKQCGNSVTVPVVRRIAEEMRRVLTTS